MKNISDYKSEDELYRDLTRDMKDRFYIPFAATESEKSHEKKMQKTWDEVYAKIDEYRKLHPERQEY